MSENRVSLPSAIPIDTAELVLARKRAGMRKSAVDIDENAKVMPRSDNLNSDILKTYTVVVRKSGRAGPSEISSRAKALKACKGLKKCEFVRCVKDALGNVPENLQKACPMISNYQSPILSDSLTMKI